MSTTSKRPNLDGFNVTGVKYPVTISKNDRKEETQPLPHIKSDIINREEFSGGFKLSGYLQSSPKQSLKEEQRGNITEERMLKDLELKPPEEPAQQNLNVNKSKADLTKEMMGSIETEIGKLKMQSESILTRKQIDDSKSIPNPMIKAQLQNNNREVLFGSPERIQVLEHKMNTETVSLEELMEMKKQHSEKLRLLEEQYNKEKKEKANPSKNSYSTKGTKWSSVRNTELERPNLISSAIKPEIVTFERNKTPKFSSTRRSGGDFLGSISGGERYYGSLAKSLSSKSLMSPKRKDYEVKLKKYIESKKKHNDFANALKYKSDNWDNFTKGIDSPTKKGVELKDKKL